MAYQDCCFLSMMLTHTCCTWQARSEPLSLYESNEESISVCSYFLQIYHRVKTNVKFICTLIYMNNNYMFPQEE